MPVYDVEIPIQGRMTLSIRDLEAENENQARVKAADLMRDAVMSVMKVVPAGESIEDVAHYLLQNANDLI